MTVEKRECWDCMGTGLREGWRGFDYHRKHGTVYRLCKCFAGYYFLEVGRPPRRFLFVWNPVNGRDRLTWRGGTVEEFAGRGLDRETLRNYCPAQEERVLFPRPKAS